MIYLIVSDLKRNEITYKVNKFIRDGYIPSGGMTIGPDGIFYQSMIHTLRFTKNIEKEANDSNSV